MLRNKRYVESWTIVLPSYLSIWMDRADRYLRAKKDRPRLDESIVSGGWRFRIDGERGVVVKWYPSRPVTAGRMLITRLINAVARVGETTDRMDRRHAPSSFFSLFLVSPFPNAFVNTFSSGDRSRPHYIIPYLPHAFLHRFLFLHLPRQSRFAKYPTLLARGKAFFSNDRFIFLLSKIFGRCWISDSIEREREKYQRHTRLRNFGPRMTRPARGTNKRIRSRFDRSFRKRAVAFDYRTRDRAHPTIRHKVVNYAKCRLEMR